MGSCKIIQPPGLPSETFLELFALLTKVRFVRFATLSISTYLKVIDRFQTVDAGNIAILEAK